jgi:hypothetical protein
MKRVPREEPPRQGLIRVETPDERRQAAGLEEDMRSSPFRGRALPLRLRNFRQAADGYLASLGGPLPYMTRLREIERLTEAHAESLTARWHELAREEDDAGAFARAWRAWARTAAFDDVNDLIARHNRWYPMESGLAMDPRSGDYALVNGQDYRLRPLDAAWVLERLPAELTLASAP